MATLRSRSKKGLGTNSKKNGAVGNSSRKVSKKERSLKSSGNQTSRGKRKSKVSKKLVSLEIIKGDGVRTRENVRSSGRARRGRAHSGADQEAAGSSSSHQVEQTLDLWCCQQALVNTGVDSALGQASTSTSKRHAQNTALREASTSTHKKCVRGRTRLEQYWNLSPQAPRVRIMANSFGQAVGKGSGTIGQFLGTAARRPQFFPLSYADFRQAPEDKKEFVWSTVQDVFDIDVNLKDWVIDCFREKWKDYKAHLKKVYYMAHRGDVSAAKRNLPPDVEQTEWDWLIDYWESDAGKKMEDTNKKNRAKVLLPHTCGSKSFARIRDEETLNNDGIAPTRAKMFILTHQRKDESPINPDAANIISKLKEVESQLSGGSESSIARNDVLSQVLGQDCHGRVRTMGLGVHPTMLWPRRSFPQHTPQTEELLKKVAESDRKTAELELKAAESERKAIESWKKVADSERQSAHLQSMVTSLVSLLGSSLAQNEQLQTLLQDIQQAPNDDTQLQMTPATTPIPSLPST